MNILNKLKRIILSHQKPIIIGSILLITIGISLFLANGGTNDMAEAIQVEEEIVTTTVTIDQTEAVTESVSENLDAEGSEEEIIEPEPEIVEGPLSILTGLPISEEAFNRRPIGIMISNISSALPQSGIGQADIIYEALVEGGITRLFAVFQDFDAEKIGPIRSARHYYLDFALDHDAIYTHVGQSPQAIAAFKVLDVDRFFGISYLDLILTFQDEERRAPHSTFTSYDHLMATWEKLEYRTEPLEDLVPKFYFEKDFELVGEPVHQISLNYSKLVGTNPYLVYDEDMGEYLRFQFDEPHIDVVTGEQLHFKNIIVQFAEQWTIKNDTEGRQDVDLVDQGNGYYLQGGQMIPITWEKTAHESTTQYYTLEGELLLMAPGKTFVSVYPTYYEDNIIME